MTTVTEYSDHIVIDRHAQDVLFRQARTANAFTSEPVTDEQVQALYDLVKWAPTSFNQQPLRVVLVRSAEARERLGTMMIDNNRAKTLAAPLTAILAADTEFHRHLPTQFPVFPQAKDVLFGDPTVREESALLNATLQIAYFIIGVRALGLAAGPMSGFDSAAVTKEFFPDGTARALVVVNLGRPADGARWDRLDRLGYEQVFTTA
ncbi:malonic semialdehyde reductase [Dactylosporangium sp. NPDC049525]|uniref:malonic semialdehyde reductase n=1 Tax=Dactylosporangium sp. NPDC049525 TaxID=3154730 RepID=UPI0034469FE6